MNTIFIVLPILTLLMFDLGLTLKPQDFKLIAQRPKPVIVGLVGQIILLPLIAWGIIALLSTFDFRLSTLFIIGIMLVACSPGGSSSNVFSMLAKGDVALSVTLTACISAKCVSAICRQERERYVSVSMPVRQKIRLSRLCSQI